LTAIEKARELAAALQDKKGLDVRVLDMGEMRSFTDYFVIATGTSERHARTLAEEVERCSSALGDHPVGIEGKETGRWILIDLDDVVVHVFQQDARQHYALERLWGEAEDVHLQRAAGDSL
jgi:ribosome-associated protein